MVEETNDSSCLNYKQIRHQFEEYDLSDLFETPKKNTTPKVTTSNGLNSESIISCIDYKKSLFLVE